MMQALKGSLVALVTPMEEGGEVDYNSLEKLVDWHIQEGTNGIVSVGTTGESATLDVEEHLNVIKHTVEYVNSRIPVIAGTGANSTSEAIELTEESKKLGADYALLVTPYYNKPNQNGLINHYTKIADEVDIPQILYNVPSRTACDLLPSSVKVLSEHNNIIGIKEASGNKDRSIKLMKLCSGDIQIFTGDDKTSMSDIIDGFSGNISVTANIEPKLMAKMCKAALLRKNLEAEDIDEILRSLHMALFLESNPIPVKWAMFRMGLIENALRLPLTPMSESNVAAVEKAMGNAKINFD